MSRRRKAATALTVVVLAGVAVALGVFLIKPSSFAAAREDDSGAPAVVSGLPATLSGGLSAAPSAAPSATDTETSSASATEAAPRTTASTPVTSDQPVATDAPVVVTSGKVPVVVTYSDWNATQHLVMVGGYAAGVVESKGVCTLTLTQGARKVTAESPAAPDASTTACGGLSVPGTKLAPGTWRAVLSYASPSSSGAAAPVDIEVGA
jgi:cytoskeletal protein RodZ